MNRDLSVENKQLYIKEKISDAIDQCYKKCTSNAISTYKPLSGKQSTCICKKNIIKKTVQLNF